MKITIIAGARPNFMKIAPLMRAINAAKAAGKNISARLVYTGSDEDKSLEPSLFTDLDMPRNYRAQNSKKRGAEFPNEEILPI